MKVVLEEYQSNNWSTICSVDIFLDQYLVVAGLTLWIYSFDGSQLYRWTQAVLVFGDDPEHVLLTFHDAHTLTFR